MKKETKRYTLVEYIGEQTRYFTNKNAYYETLEIIRKNNKSTKSKFYFGNAKCEELNPNLFKVTVHVYNRLTPKSTISDIDSLTSKGYEYDLANKFRGKLRTISDFMPDIQIMYFEEKNKKDKTSNDFDIRIKYIPVLYRRDKRFLDKKYVKSCISFAASPKERDIRFFKELAYEFCAYHTITPEIELLRKYIDLAERDDYYFENLKIVAIRLYEAFIKERNTDKSLHWDQSGEVGYSRRRLRDFGFFIRNYMLPDYKILSPTRYNQPLTEEQLQKLRIKKNEDKQIDKGRELKRIKKAEQLNLFDK